MLETCCVRYDYLMNAQAWQVEKLHLRQRSINQYLLALSIPKADRTKWDVAGASIVVGQKESQRLEETSRLTGCIWL